MDKTWDAVIVGAGPAGASCAVWLRHLGFDPLLLEARDCVGGLAASNPFPDIWTVTSPNQSGTDVAKQIARQVEAAGVDLWLDAVVQTVRSTDSSFEICGARGLHQHFHARGRTLVIASGVRPRELPGHERKTYPGVIVGPGQAVMAADFDGTRVAILGGGDNAFENYGYVRSRGAKTCHIYARSIKAQKHFVRSVQDNDLRLGPIEIEPGARRVNGEQYDWILVFFGWQPNADFLKDLSLRMDQRGFVWTDPVTAQTSQAGVYAIGEVAQRMHPCVPTAMADGVVAAKAIESRLSK